MPNPDIPSTNTSQPCKNKPSRTPFFGYHNLAAACPEVYPADVEANVKSMLDMINRISSETETSDTTMPQVVCFPELSVTGYTCADLLGQDFLLDTAENALQILADSLNHDTILIAGAPLRHNNRLYNCAVVIGRKSILGVVPKTNIPNYAEFYEARWFDSGAGITNTSIVINGRNVPFGTDLIFQTSDGMRFGIEICEDLWVASTPSTSLCESGADVIFNLSASDELIGKHDYLLSMLRSHSASCRCAYIYASAGLGESSTDLVFSGNAIAAYNGNIIRQSERFSLIPQYVTAQVDVEKLRRDRRVFNTYGRHATTDSRNYRTIGITCNEPSASGFHLMHKVDRTPFVPSGKDDLDARCREILDIQTWGLMQRLRSTHCRNAVIGISGGLDSTLALLVCVRTFDRLSIPRKNILGVTMPGFGTTVRTHSNASVLMELLGVDIREISINDAVSLHFRDINHNPCNHDATYENSQARERTQILMDLANQTGGMVIGTGDLSELALGWCTYNGDQMSMYGVNASVPKTLVRHLVAYEASREKNHDVAATLNDIVDTPISPELIPAAADGTIEQRTEDLVGPYILHDFYLYHILRNGFSPAKIYFLAQNAFAEEFDNVTLLHWLRTFYKRFFSQQFKRSAMPDGPKVGSVCLSPRGDWRMPSDATASIWLNQIDSLKP